jgi:hypothetical protein
MARARNVRGLLVGALAGAAGTAAMDVVLYRRFRRDGGKDGWWHWESAAGVMGWDEASAPGQIGRKLQRLVTSQEPPDDWARATTNAVHWATGIGWGVQYGVVAAMTARSPWLRAVAIGPVAWLASYVVLPLVGVYQPIWKYDARTLGKDLSAHLVFGGVTSATFAAITGAGR